MSAGTPATELTDAERDEMAAGWPDFWQVHAAVNRILAARAKPAPSGDEREAEPLCCDEPMVRYPGVAWECAASFFRLQDDEAIDDMGTSPPILNDDASGFHRSLYAHLLATRLPMDEDYRILADRRTVSPAPSGAEAALEPLADEAVTAWKAWRLTTHDVGAVAKGQDRTRLAEFNRAMDRLRAALSLSAGPDEAGYQPCSAECNGCPKCDPGLSAGPDTTEGGA